MELIILRGREAPETLSQLTDDDIQMAHGRGLGNRSWGCGLSFNPLPSTSCHAIGSVVMGVILGKNGQDCGRMHGTIKGKGKTIGLQLQRAGYFIDNRIHQNQ